MENSLFFTDRSHLPKAGKVFFFVTRRTNHCKYRVGNGVSRAVSQNIVAPLNFQQRKVHEQLADKAYLKVPVVHSLRGFGVQL